MCRHRQQAKRCSEMKGAHRGHGLPSHARHHVLGDPSLALRMAPSALAGSFLWTSKKCAKRGHFIPVLGTCFRGRRHTQMRTVTGPLGDLTFPLSYFGF